MRDREGMNSPVRQRHMQNDCKAAAIKLLSSRSGRLQEQPVSDFAEFALLRTNSPAIFAPTPSGHVLAVSEGPCRLCDGRNLANFSCRRETTSNFFVSGERRILLSGEHYNNV